MSDFTIKDYSCAGREQETILYLANATEVYLTFMSRMSGAYFDGIYCIPQLIGRAEESGNQPSQ